MFSTSNRLSPLFAGRDLAVTGQEQCSGSGKLFFHAVALVIKHLHDFGASVSTALHHHAVANLLRLAARAHPMCAAWQAHGGCPDKYASATPQVKFPSTPHLRD